MAKRKLDNPLALAVMATLAERPCHPYEIAQLLRARGKDQSIRINYGSLYTVVQSLERHGFIAASGVEREGRRPARTLYDLTDAGHRELHDWLRELVSVPVKEYPSFEAALSLMAVLPPDEALALLRERTAHLDSNTSALAASLEDWTRELPRIFLVEAEYELAMLRAEAEWLRGLIQEMADGTLSGMDGWRQIHATGQVPEEFEEMNRRALAAQKEGAADRRG